MIPYASRYPRRRTSRLVRERSHSRYSSPPLLKVIYWTALTRAMKSAGNAMFYKAVARLPVSGLSASRGYFTRPMQRPVTMRGRLFRNRRRA